MKGGFFFPESEIVGSVEGCFTCKLYRGCISPKMEPTGEGKRGLLIIAEAPGRREDEKGTQLIGQSGQVLRSKLSDLGIDLDKDCRKIDAISCRPPDNRMPTGEEIAACRSRVWKEIREYKPKVILLLGGPALESFLAHRWPEALEGIGKWRGWAIPDRDSGAWVVPTFHPSFIDRGSSPPVAEVIWERDLKLAISLLGTPFPQFKDERECVEVISEEGELSQVLESIYKKVRKDRMLTALDYETTGLKPYAEGHRVVSASISAEENKAYSFLFPDPFSPAFSWWYKILQCKDIPKTAYNMKFEDTWSRVKLNIEVKGWEWCSMQGAHVLDNRPGINGLDFQMYVRFGLLPWDGVVGGFLKSKDKKDGNSFNNIDKAPVRELLKYGGIDALGQRRLAIIQRAEAGL